MAIESTTRLIDRVYEAAFVPEFWPGVLQSLCDASNSASSALLALKENAEPKFLATDYVRDALSDYHARGGLRSSEALAYCMEVPCPSFLHEADFFPADVLARDTRRRELTEPLGLAGQIGTIIPMPSGEVVVISFERWRENDRPSEGELSILDAFRPHIARAGLMSARLGLEQARSTVSALEAIGLPAAVLTRTGRVLATNPSLDGLDRIFLPAAHGRLILAQGPANQLFQEALDAADHAGEPVVRSIPVPADAEGGQALVLQVLPLRRAAFDIFSGADILVVASVFTASALVPAPTVLTGLFDLSAAEAHLASALASGLTLQEAAAQRGITVKTGRGYLERIFAKTGTRQQSELVALLKSTRPLGSSPRASADQKR